MPRVGRLQYPAACLLVIAYAGLSHYCNAAGVRTLGAALAVAPPCLLVLVLAWRKAPWPAAALLTAGLGVGLQHFWPLLERKFSWVCLVQETSVYAALGLTFSRSLAREGTAICTRLADRLHGPLSSREVLYTRRVTAAWAVFFFSIAAISLLLFIAAPLPLWSIYINFCVLPLVGAMFVAEHRVRRRALPHVRRVGLLATVRFFLANSSVS